MIIAGFGKLAKTRHKEVCW